MTLLENNYSGFNTSRNEGRSKLDQNKMKMSSNMDPMRATEAGAPSFILDLAFHSMSILLIPLGQLVENSRLVDRFARI